MIKRSKKSTLKESTIIISAVLILFITIVLAATPFWETFYPHRSGDSKLASIFTYIAIIGTLTATAWGVLLFITFIRQTIIILTSKFEK